MLQILDRFGSQGAFSPEDVLILVAAFDEAWSRLEQSGVRFDDKHERELTRNALGKFIIEDARSGERDKGRLRDNALLLYSKSNLKQR